MKRLTWMIFLKLKAGSQQIISLIINSSSITQPDDNINITFSNKYSEKVDDQYSIKYKVRGGERDWVMISSSLIEDRLNKITNKDFGEYFSKSVFLSIIPVIILGVMALLFNSMDDMSQNNKTRKVISDVESHLLKKDSIDLIRTIIDIEKSKVIGVQTLLSRSLPTKLLLYILIPIMFLLSISDIIKKNYFRYFPTCVFYWSDFMDKYDKMKKNRNLVLGFIFITFFLSVFINLFSSYLWEKFAK